MKWLKALKKPFMTTLTLLIICGIIYPVFMTVLSGALFKDKANGSLVYADGEAVGATYVGQDFTDPRFMKCRPSAYNYNTYTDEQKQNGEYAGLSSGSNNYAPSNPALTERVEQDINEFLQANPAVKREDLPADIVTASGSGLDPHISPKAAEIQIKAISENTGLSEEEVKAIVENNTTDKAFGIFGEQVVNVLGVNLDIAKAVGMVSEIEK